MIELGFWINLLDEVLIKDEFLNIDEVNGWNIIKEELLFKDEILLMNKF